MKHDINYHHLQYFWVVAREGSVARATERLGVAQPTISAQLKSLERSLGLKLFERKGRGLTLTDAGRHVLNYADQIFSLGRALSDSLSGSATSRPQRFVIGVTDALVKMVTYRLLEPVFRLKTPIHISYREDQTDRLAAALALHSIDMVLTDSPMTVGPIKAYSHFLGECGVTFFASEKLAKLHQKDFPRSLHGAPCLLPSEATLLRRGIERFFTQEQLKPRVVAEFDDSSLLKSFGQAGFGIFCAPSIIEKEVQKQYQVKAIGRTDGIKERFYAVSLERRLKHPASVAISTEARQSLFGS